MRQQSAGPAALRMQQLPPAQLQRCARSWWHDVLAVVGFEGAQIAPPVAAIPTVRLSLPLLGATPAVEVLHAAPPLRSGERGPLRFRANDSLLFACIELAEGSGTHAADGSLATATARAYGELFGSLDALGYPHLLRVWNFLPDIHGGSGRSERYGQFNGARQDAFLEARRSIAGDVPAASVLGVRSAAPLCVYALAAREAPIALENPRQQSAWNYPRRYSPRRPTFARACLAGDGAAGSALFISGTASIVGHRTLHADDVAAQTREALCNIDALLGCANAQQGEPRWRLPALSYRVYLRHGEHLDTVAAQLRSRAGHATAALYLLADMCRRDLLVEIEAMGL